MDQIMAMTGSLDITIGPETERQGPPPPEKRHPIPVVETKVMFVVGGRSFDNAHAADRYAFALSIANALQEEFGSSQHPDNWRDAAEFIVDNFNIRPQGD